MKDWNGNSTGLVLKPAVRGHSLAVVESWRYWVWDRKITETGSQMDSMQLFTHFVTIRIEYTIYD